MRCAPTQPRQAAANPACTPHANATRGPSHPLRPQTKPPPLLSRPAHHLHPHSVQRPRVFQVFWSIVCIRCLDLLLLLLAVLPYPPWTLWTLNTGRGLMQPLPKKVMGSPLSSSTRSKITLDLVIGECYSKKVRHMMNRVVLP